MAAALARRGFSSKTKDTKSDKNKPLPPTPNPQTNRKPLPNPDRLLAHHPTPMEHANAKATHRKPVPPPKDY